MSPAKRLLGALISAAGFAAGSISAFPCGFEDPTSVSSARGALNWAYPNALYVKSDVWRAQQAGTIGRDEAPSPVKALLGYQKTAARLGEFRDRLTAALGGRAPPAFSMVLIGPMLWTRFEPASTVLNMTSHTSGPSNGDVVVVTDGPVLAALIDGRITPQSARELGLFRFFGSAEAIEGVTSWFDRFPRQTITPATSVID